MEWVLENITEIKRIRTEIKKMIERKKALTAPVITDLSLMPLVYSLFRKMVDKSHFTWKYKETDRRKIFVFIALCLYSPESLAGWKIRQGLRKEIAKVTGVRTLSAISNNRADAIGYYCQYANFEASMKILLREMVEELRKKELVK